MPSQVAITHGDLHGSNIIVSELERTWLIDFYKTGWGPALRDFAELESDIKFDMLSTESLRERFDLERALLATQRLDEPVKLTKPSPQQSRAIETVKHLRELACRLTDTESTREYFMSLLFFALKRIVGFTSPNVDEQVGTPQQYHALLSAAMICERLQQEARTVESSAGAPVQVFLSYSSEDRTRVEEIYQRLSSAGFKPWMDKRDIVGGEEWETAIENGIRNSQVFIACLSRNSINKRGIIQKEIKRALEIYEELLPGDIFPLPLLLEDCDIPRRLAKFHALSFDQPDGWNLLLAAIQTAMVRRSR
jgi:hypothetical protein